MRSEKEMMDLILEFVTTDESIRAAVLNGSRANPDARKDFFQDYDVACYVTRVEPLVGDRAFLKRFGELMRMVTWYFGIKTGFRKSPGKAGKHLKHDLDPALWSMLEDTYADADFDRMWDSLFVMGELFRTVARDVANTYGFEYPEGDDARVSAHLRHVRNMPKDAQEMY